mgnify:CR=1 FL=1
MYQKSHDSIKYPFVFALGLALCGPLAGSPERGLEIAEETKARDTGYGDFSTTATMTLRDASGRSSVREMTVQTLEVPDVGEKSLITFLAPADTRDTALLSYSYKAESDDQWIYLPSMRRTRRIASGNKSGSFVGSEFSYEDISPQQVEKYTYPFLREEELDSDLCFVIERFPVDPRSSGYSRQVRWIDQAEYRPLKAENFDRRDALLKTLVFEDYRQYEAKGGTFWRPLRMEMTNHQSGKSTLIEYQDYVFDAGLDDSLFDSRRLGRR